MARLYSLLLWCSLYAGAVQVAAQVDGSFWWANQKTPPVDPAPTQYPKIDPDGMINNSSDEEDATWCECVLWYQCEDNVIITDGSGMLDLRTKPVKNVEICPNLMHICCGIPQDTVATVQPVTTELPPNTPCNCVSYQQCPRHLIVNDHHGEICLDVVGTTFSHSKCPHTLDACCASDTTVASLMASYINTISNPENCDCVEPHMCDRQGYIRSNNEEISNEMYQREKPRSYSHNLCSNSSLSCCRPRVECECINQNMCDEDGFIKTDGEGLIDFRSLGSGSETQGRCEDPCQICCKVREEVTTTTTIKTSVTDSLNPTVECYCVEESQCNDESQYNYGEGLIGVRIYTSEESCSNPEHICCKSPITPETASPTTTIQPLPPTNYNCGTRNRKNALKLRIVGFHDGQSQFGEFPWVATVLREEVIMGQPHFLFVGGGTLIHPRVVLTAAHKIKSLRSDKLLIRLGEWDTRTDKEPLPHQDVEVERLVIHPDYNENNLQNDVGLIFLKEEAANNEHIQKICLANDVSEVDPNDCVINGWGKEGFDNDATYQEILKSVTLPLVNSHKCQTQLRKTRLGRYFRLHNSFVCAGGEAGVDGCRGDGGGPLACARKDNKDKYLLVGITAWGIGCGDEGVPGVYVNVPLFADWIRDHIEAVHPSTVPPVIRTLPPVITTQPQDDRSIMPKRQCMGICKAVGSYCNGKMRPRGCDDGEQCCMKGGKRSGVIRVPKKCKGQCQALGSGCDGKVRPRLCGDGRECCMGTDPWA